MGLDDHKVRQVIPLGGPNDIESYIQETGRAGRDYQPALATLLVENHNNQYRDKSMLKLPEKTIRKVVGTFHFKIQTIISI